MNKNEDKIKKKIQKVKDEFLLLLDRMKESLHEKSREDDSLIHKLSTSIEDLDSFTKEKWSLIGDEFRRAAAQSIEQLNNQKKYLLEWYEKTKEDLTSLYTDNEENSLPIDDIEDLNEAKEYINRLSLNIEEMFTQPGGVVNSFFNSSVETKRDFSLMVEMLRRSDVEFDTELRKHLFTLETFPELLNK